MREVSLIFWTTARGMSREVIYHMRDRSNHMRVAKLGFALFALVFGALLSRTAAAQDIPMEVPVGGIGGGGVHVEPPPNLGSSPGSDISLAGPLGSLPPPPPPPIYHYAVPAPVILQNDRALRIKENTELVLDFYQLLRGGENAEAMMWNWINATAHVQPVIVTVSAPTFNRAEVLKQLVHLEIKAATMVATKLHADIALLKASGYQWQETPAESHAREAEAVRHAETVAALKQQAVEQARSNVTSHWQDRGSSFRYRAGSAFHQLSHISVSNWH
jgi:hypothetical protein